MNTFAVYVIRLVVKRDVVTLPDTSGFTTRTINLPLFRKKESWYQMYRSKVKVDYKLLKLSIYKCLPTSKKYSSRHC